jgi:predicted glycosyltransferase involved in capsule biosynthesis
MATTDVVVSLDTDCIVPIESILLCKNELLNGATVAWPYNGYFIDISGSLRNKIINSQFNYGDILQQMDKQFKMPLSSLYKDFYVRCTDNEHLGTGGIVMFNKKLFMNAGGYNENFIGWGCEDNEIVSRLNILEHKMFRHIKPKAICFHLYHNSAQRDDNPFFEKNAKEWHTVKDMNKKKLEKYIKTWHWL